ncbi:MAG: hypothetical protein RML93_03750 [Anaerolineales bacterium]|nr:hypothetical protein [Anaerolineales bacterium]MDW8446390.1 hypothetical protein [Anaerolineales bacterium]
MKRGIMLSVTERMSSVDEIRALIQRIAGDNELRTEFRRAILPDEEYNLLKLVQETSANVARVSLTLDELAKAQKRTEECLNELAVAQKGTEEALKRLAAAQEGSEERIRHLEATMAELTAAQRRSEERFDKLAAAQEGSEERIRHLEATMAELAEAQRRTEKALEELAAAQRRTEERFEKLAAAQEGSEERIRHLEATMAELAEVRKENEKRFARIEMAIAALTEAQKQMSSKLARLDERIGVSTEQEAADMLSYVLRHKGYEILSGPFNLPLDGEIDVLYSVQDAEGRTLTAVLEAKTRLGYSAVDRWARAINSVELRQRLAEKGYPGPYLVYVYGMRADPSAYEAARKFGVGLITDRGEQIEPAGLIPPADR